MSVGEAFRNKAKGWADEIPVYCAHSDIIDIIEVIPNPRNPNVHKDAQIDLLARIIKAQGWRNPIVISKLSGFITKGHGRLLLSRVTLIIPRRGILDLFHATARIAEIRSRRGRRISCRATVGVRDAGDATPA